MKQVFERLDKYKDFILKRSDFLIALRTDEMIVDFVDVDCVQFMKETLTLDQMFSIIERDGGELHKQYITWREFMQYFNEYNPGEIVTETKQDVKTTVQQEIQKRLD